MEHELSYYSKDGQLKTLKLRSKFLTPFLRSQIIKLDAATQLAFKDYEKAEKEKEDPEKVNQQKERIDAFVAETRANYPSLTDDDIEKSKQNYIVKLLSDMSPEDIKSTEEVLINNWSHNDKWTVEFFKLTTDTSLLSDEDKKLFASDYDSDFWLNVDIGKVVEINKSFRSNNSI